MSLAAGIGVSTRTPDSGGLVLAACALDPLLIGLQDQTGPSFVRCTIEHCTPLGYGFYQIGLHPEEVVPVREDEIAKLRRSLEQHDHQPVGVGN